MKNYRRQRPGRCDNYRDQRFPEQGPELNSFTDIHAAASRHVHNWSHYIAMTMLPSWLGIADIQV